MSKDREDKEAIANPEFVSRNEYKYLMRRLAHPEMVLCNTCHGAGCRECNNQGEVVNLVQYNEDKEAVEELVMVTASQLFQERTGQSSLQFTLLKTHEKDMWKREARKELDR